MGDQRRERAEDNLSCGIYILLLAWVVLLAVVVTLHNHLGMPVCIDEWCVPRRGP